MYNYSVDFSAIGSIEEAHAVLATSLRLPDYYGRNADALWDCLTGCIGLPATIHVRGGPRLRAVDEAAGALLCAVLIEAEKTNSGIEVIWVDDAAQS